jgi:putative ABC transport system ATP-binding protein
MVVLDNASKVYKLGKHEVLALKDVNLTVKEGEFISVVGPSGSGKSTLLNLIGCIDTPTSGTVSIMGKDVVTYKDAALSKLRNETIGFIFQSFNLVPVLNAFENIEYPLVILGVPKTQRIGRTTSILHEVGLEDFAKHRPEELSGGQRQRVAIARALVTEPEIVLADEPTANLDSTTGFEILDLMQKMNEEHKTTFIFSTHDPKIEKYAKTIYTMKDGDLTQ